MIKTNYITFASWEERFLEGAKNQIDSIGIIYCLFFEDSPHYDVIVANRNQLKEIAKEHSIEIKDIPVKFADYVNTWQSIKSGLSDICTEKETIVDISTMPRNVIFYLFFLLKDKDIDFKIFYNPANDHGKQPTTNPLQPHIVLRHGGVMNTDKKNLLVVFLGYDRERVYQLLNYFEPDKTIVFFIKSDKMYTHPPESYSSNFDGPNLQMIEIDGPSGEIAFDALEKNITTENFDKYNVLLCSLGPKIQATGIYKYHFAHDNCALVYSPSKEYSLDYSTGIKTMQQEVILSSWIFRAD